MATLESLDPRIEELWNVSFGLTTEKGRSCRFNVAQESNPLIHFFFFPWCSLKTFFAIWMCELPTWWTDPPVSSQHICFVILAGWLRAEEYFGEMPWLALDFSDRKLKEPGMDGVDGAASLFFHGKTRLPEFGQFYSRNSSPVLSKCRGSLR